MMVDIVNVGWVPVFVVNLSDDIPGYLAMPATALTYPWKTLISGHLGRLGTREDVVLHQQYMADLEASARTALDTVDPTPYFQKYGAVGNMWAAVKAYLNAVGDATAAPVIEKYTGVLAAADVFTPDVAFWLMESIRLNRGIRPAGAPMSAVEAAATEGRSSVSTEQRATLDAILRQGSLPRRQRCRRATATAERVAVGAAAARRGDRDRRRARRRPDRRDHGRRESNLATWSCTSTAACT